MDIVECGRCYCMFRNFLDTCGVCPKCGHDNDDADHIRPAQVTG